jgi:hypothetical protein
MTANLMTTIYSLEKMPWHKNAFVSTSPMGAVEASSVIESVYYEKRPVAVFINGGQQQVKDFAIVRSPIPSDPTEKIVGYAKKGYNILQPLDICAAFDENVKQPVETLGFLGSTGEKLFLTWSLPGFDVNGDEIQLYGFVAVGYDGKFGATLYVVSVRVICANTFTMAVSEGESIKEAGRGKIWSGRHNSLNLDRDLGIWMGHVQNKALNKSQSASVIFNTMAKVAIDNQKIAEKLIYQIYPDPKTLPKDFPDQLRDEKQDKIDILASKAEKDRAMVMALFGGQGIAIDATAFGLFNAVTQAENHNRMEKKPANYSILFGARAKQMAAAFNVLSAYSKGK